MGGRLLDYFARSVHILVILTRRGVKMAEYFARLWARPVSSLVTKQAWSIKDVLYGFRENFSRVHSR